jgi:DMSO reductase iron-sulfur subunit
MTKGFLLDLNRCTGCQACGLACTIENGLPFGSSWRRIDTYNESRHPAAPAWHLSLACNHCAEAPCMSSCPTLAIRRDASTGAVLIEQDACIGCGYCVWACPYDAPRYDAEDGVMRKCTFCNDRLHERLDPACVSHCPTGALGYGALGDGGLDGEGGPDGDGRVAEVPGCPELGIGPAIRFTPLKDDRTRPQLDGAAAANAVASSSPAIAPGVARAESAITLRGEWPLVLFTLIAATLVALVIGAAAGAVTLPPGVFLATALLGMGLGTMHLGRKERAWRAVLNVRRSWLSREVVLYSVFVAVTTVWLRFAPGSFAAGAASALLGLGALFAIDRVYDVTGRRTTGRLHSADVILTGPFLAALFIVSPLLAAPLSTAKLLLYLWRKLQNASREEDARSSVSVLRIGIGLLAPAVLWFYDPVQLQAGIIGCVAIGEIIDRCEFYDELDTRAPRKQMAFHLKQSLAAGWQADPVGGRPGA